MNACKLFESLRIPLRLRVFESGVLVVQSLSHSEQAIIEDTTKQVFEGIIMGTTKDKRPSLKGTIFLNNGYFFTD